MLKKLLLLFCFCLVGSVVLAAEEAAVPTRNKYNSASRYTIFNGIQIGTTLRNYDSTLKLGHTPLAQIGYSRFDMFNKREMSIDLAFSPQAKNASQTLLLANENTSAYLNRYSIISLGASLRGYFDRVKFVDKSGFFYEGGARLTILSDTEANASVNGLELGIALGEYFELTPGWFLEPSVGANYTFFTSANVRGTPGPLNPTISGLDVQLGVKSVYYF